MDVDTRGKRMRDSVRMLAYLALLIGTVACNERYAHGRIPVDDATRTRWEAGEKEAEEAGRQLVPIAPTHGAPDRISQEALPALLAHVDSSDRHGAGDKRLLSLPDTNGFRSANILAEIVLVKGSEYKSEKDFRSGWIPVAIVYRPQGKGFSSDTYQKFQLTSAPVSWIFVREDSSSKWLGAIVHADGRGYVQTPLAVNVAEMDSVEPVIGARFVWQDDDEIVWTYCGGKCCQVRDTK